MSRMNTAELARRLDNIVPFGVIDQTDFTSELVQPCLRSADLRETLKIKREQTWKDASLREIFSTIALLSQLHLKIEPPLAAEIIAHMDQANESDANIISQLAHCRPDLIPKQIFSLIGVKDEIDAITWLGSNVSHEFSSNSCTTSLELDDITELADLADYYIDIVAYYKDKNGKQQKMEKGDMTKPKRIAHLYANVHLAKKAVDREFSKQQRS